MWYIGLKKNRGMEVFQSGTRPTVASHGHRYVNVAGPYKTKLGAKMSVLAQKILWLPGLR